MVFIRFPSEFQLSKVFEYWKIASSQFCSFVLSRPSIFRREKVESERSHSRHAVKQAQESLIIILVL